MTIKEILKNADGFVGKTVNLKGWVRNHRKQNVIGFIDMFDGSCFESMQIVYSKDTKDFAKIETIRIGSAISIEGELVQGKMGYEIKAKKIVIEGDCPENYPLQPKKHSLEFLREIAYLRPRTRVFQAVFRIRHLASMAIHNYFHENGYVMVHSPILTALDAEGAGEAFHVTPKDFFGKQASLTVSGQLQAETFALAFGKTYTFGPTFRAENSNTKTHAAEFWMIEPEIAFCDLDGVMTIQEEFLKYVAKYILDNANSELEFLSQFNGVNIKERLQNLLSSKIARVTHKDAIDILIKANKTDKFQFEPKQGGDLAKEHEKYLTDVHFKSPVFVYNWPKDIKAFYMYLNDDNTVAAVDLLVPGSGELMGGSQREDREEVLISRMKQFKIEKEGMEWYLNLRKFGGCTHAGFGMGFERLVMYLTGMENIRDVIPYYRTPGNCEF